MGRIPLDELIHLYAADPATIVHPVLLIRINRLYRYDMTDQEFYEATRGVWYVGGRREKVDYALAVFRGIVREVYAVQEWHPAGTTPYVTDIHDRVNVPGRWEFTGVPAPDEVHDRYLNKSVEHYFSEHAQNPITYVNC